MLSEGTFTLSGWIVASVLNTPAAERELARVNAEQSLLYQRFAIPLCQLNTHSFKYRERWGRVIKSGELFPRYLFISGSWQALLGHLAAAQNVLRLVSSANDGRPCVIDDAAFNALRAREDREGFVWLNDRTVSFKKGQRVKVAAGPFTGCAGFVKGMKPKDRVEVMLRFFGATRAIDFPTGELLAA